MRDVLLVAVTLVVSLVTPPVIAVAQRRARSRVVPVRVRRQVLVTTKAGSTFEGVLFESDRDAVVLRAAVHHVPGERSTPVDGEVLILTGDVLFMQFP